MIQIFGTQRYMLKKKPWEMGPPASLGIYIKMNGGRRPNQGRGTANQNEPGRGKHPHSSSYTEIDGVQCYHSDKCQGRDWWTPFLQDCLRTFTVYILYRGPNLIYYHVFFLSCVCSKCALTSFAIVLSPAVALLVVVTKSSVCVHYGLVVEVERMLGCELCRSPARAP